MKRILKKNEIGRCKHCGSSVVISPFYVDHGKKRHLVYGGGGERAVTKIADARRPVQKP